MAIFGEENCLLLFLLFRQYIPDGNCFFVSWKYRNFSLLILL